LCRAQFECRVAEGQAAGTRICNVTAEDKDSPENSKMRYSIVPGVEDYAYFSIDPSTGLVTSDFVFDLEQQNRYR
jgi:hypothetical protein